MQVNTLTKDNNPDPNRRLMQQAFTRLMMPSHFSPLATGFLEGYLRGSPNRFIRPVWGVNFIRKIDLVDITTGCFCQPVMSR
jgi:hypothetical protein